MHPRPFIRPINPKDKTEIRDVVQKMRATLVEVMGTKQGEEYYSDEWLEHRVYFHLNLKESACIFLADIHDKTIGQAIVRIEKEDEKAYGFFSTLYVCPEYRRRGIAKCLIESVLKWCEAHSLSRVIYNTAADHHSVIHLFKSFDFKEILWSTNQMVQLERSSIEI